jgi:hypothetical protein
MNGAYALDHTVLHKRKDLMMGDAGDHMIHRTWYLANGFVTWDAEDLLFLYADRINRSVERELQVLAKICKSLTLGILRDTHNGN